MPESVVEWTDGAAWDEFVRAAEGGTFCHLWGWREVFGRGFGHPVHMRAVTDDGRLQGVHPLVRVRSLLFGDYLVSMPFLNYGGPLGSAAARTLLAEDAGRLAADAGVDLLELRARRSLDTTLDEVHRKVTVVLPLGDDADHLFKKGLKAKVRSQVRRPMKAGMTARVGPEGVDDFYGVFAQHMRDLGTPVLPRSLFHDLRRVFADEVVFAVVYAEDRPVAGGCGFAFGDEFEITWASSLREFSREAPNMLLYWSLMEEMIRRGVATFNFGRCTPGGGTHRFKRQWGGEDEPLPWYQWSDGERAATPNPDGGFGLAVRAWQRLPLPVANRIGPLLARRIP
ncbi:MAG: FemAB family PEP-CTERM system-associated protein [Gemmatimonadetes bacterium]|nr:FemAB family PEP-CTERM system-associated protein [Gemmatimonadota bacterium]NNK64744.1 FemAB family PEP-CTERM system-associated protein [Gemmatimonadota bacterium]